MATTPALQEQDAPEWYDFVVDFDNTYNSFMTNYDALLKLGPVVARNPGLFPDYDSLVNRGADLYNQLNRLKATRDYAASWLNWVQSGATGVFNYIGRAVGLQGLGVAPILAIAGLASATAVLIAAGSYIADLIKFSQRSNLAMQLEATGKYTPAQIAEMVTGTFGKPPTGGLFGLDFNWIIYAALAIYLGPPIIAALTSKGNR
jgi:hypothetical protein